MRIKDKNAGSKEKLLAATIELISSKGFGNTGINEILANANVTKSNFYYHFRSKEELCLTALERMANHFFEKIVGDTLLNSFLSPKARLESYLKKMTENMKSNCCKCGCPFINVGNETCDFFPAFQEKIASFFKRYQEVIQVCYEDGVDVGEFRDDIQAETIATLILSQINGTIILTKVFRNPEIIRKNWQALFDLISKQK